MADRDDFHLPKPSSLPIVLSIGIALILFGFVPDARIWRLTMVSVGGIIATGAAWLWLRDSMAEYRELD
jgi:hypothetical protein